MIYDIDAVLRNLHRILKPGGVMSSVSHLSGLAKEELDPADLDILDPDYDVIVAARVVKA